MIFQKISFSSQKSIAWCDQAMFLSFAALIYFLPISIALVEVFFCLALLSFFLKRGLTFWDRLQTPLPDYERRTILQTVQLFFISVKPVANDLNWPIACFILVGFCSIFVSQYPLLSIKGFFFKLLEWTYCYFLLVECLTTRKRLKLFIMVLLLGAGLSLANGFFQIWIGHDFVHGKALVAGRVSSSFRHPNDFAGFLLVVLPFFLNLFLWEKKSRFVPGQTGPKQEVNFRLWAVRLLGLLLLAAALTCLGLTLSRGAWLAFLFMAFFLGLSKPKYSLLLFFLVVVFLVSFSHRLEEQRGMSLFSERLSTRSVGITSPVAGIGCGRQSLKENGSADQENLWDHSFHSLLTLLQNTSGSGRRAYWQESMLIIYDSPWLGKGINTYSKVGSEYKITWGGYPHNCYLQLTAEMGFAGLISLLWIILVFFIKSLRRIARMSDPFLVYVVWAALTGLFGYLVHSAVDTNFYSVQLGNLSWLLMGMVVAAQQLDLKEPDSCVPLFKV